MPKGVYKHEHSPWNKGKSGYKTKPATEERKMKSRLSNIGKKRSDETRRRIGLSGIGRIPWNNGKKTGKISESARLNHSVSAKKSRVGSWMKGRKLSLLTIEKLKKRTGSNSGHWKGGVSADRKSYANKYYAGLTEEKRKKYSWTKNKRNRVIKRLRVEGNSHTFGEWEILKAQYNYTCPSCSEEEPKIKLTEDHIIPLSKGGSDKIENIQPLCGSCNFKKHTNTTKY